MATVADVQAKIDKYLVNMGRLDLVINGPATGGSSTVTLDGGVTVKTLARLIAEGSISVADASSYATRAETALASAQAIADTMSALSSDVATLKNTTAPGLRTDVSALQTAMGTANTGIGSLGGRVTTLEGLITAISGGTDGLLYSQRGRPGDGALRLFSSVSTGPASGRPDLTIGTVQTNDDMGAVIRIGGADVGGSGYVDIAPKAAYPVIPGHVYRISVQLERATNGSDPESLGPTIQLRVGNLSKTKGTVSNVQIGADRNPVVADGPVNITAFISRTSGTGIDYSPPATTRYVTPVIRIYGSTQYTDIAFIQWDDVTDAFSGSANVTAAISAEADRATAALGAESSRAIAAENALATSLGGKLSSSRVVGTSGLASGGGALTGDLTITVPKASVGDVAAGTDDTKAVTPLSMAALGATVSAFGADFTTVKANTARFFEGYTATVSSDPYGMLTGDLDVWFEGAGGNMALGLQLDGTVIAETLRSRNLTVLGSLTVSGTDLVPVAQSFQVTTSPPVVVTDPLGLITGPIDSYQVDGAGNLSNAVQQDGTVIIPTLRVGSLTILGAQGSSYAAKDADNLARSAQYKSRMVTAIQRATAKYNVKEINGQSLGEGDETWPALSILNKYGNKMLGGNPLPQAYPTTPTPTITPFIDSNLHDLYAKTKSGSTLIDSTGEAALTPTDLSVGEPPIHGWLNSAKFFLNQKLMLENDTSRIFVGVVTARGGTTIEQNSKWASGGLLTCGIAQQDSTDRYTQAMDALTKIKAACGADTCVVTTSAWMQGENNRSNHGGSWDKASYKRLFAQYIVDKQTDIMTLTGQVLPPLILMYQTSGSWVTDVDSSGNPGSHIAMAQLEIARDTPTAKMVGPIYPYTDKGGHLDSNGSRWFGNQIAKVEHKILVEGQDWDPVKPIKVEVLGPRLILIHHHVPEPPLVWRLPYVVNTATDYTNKGFRVTDTGGAASITNVSLVGQTLVLITLSRDLVMPTVTDKTAIGYDETLMPHVWYASATTYSGNGCLFDSDTTVAPDKYVYVTGSGMYSSANIAALVNKPYPLNNPCVVYYHPVNYSEID